MENIIDSGTRRDFGTGAVRDMAEGKGRMDLLPLSVIADWYAPSLGGPRGRLHYDFLLCMDNAVRHCNLVASVKYAIDAFVDIAFNDSVSTAILEYAKHMEAGCNKYGDRNWEHGIPVNVYLDSALRHFFKYMRHDDDERHDRAVLWNLWCCLWTIKHKPEMVDAPVGGAT